MDIIIRPKSSIISAEGNCTFSLNKPYFDEEHCKLVDKGKTEVVAGY
jgi:CDGSH-type Zn-finger protein